MVGVGVDTNIIELAKAITPGNVVIALAIVIGALSVPALVGYLVGFFPIDSAITAGLCMANAAVPETWQYLVPVIVWV